MTKIELNNLTKSQLEDLEKQIAEAKQKLNTTYGRKRVEKGSRYYYFHLSDWSINSSTEVNYSADTARFNFWNYYLTREEAEQARDRQLAIVRVNDAIDKLNWDWEYDKETPCYLFLLRDWIIKIDRMKDYNVASVIKYMKSSKIAEQIFSEYENDIKIIFNIE